MSNSDFKNVGDDYVVGCYCYCYACRDLGLKNVVTRQRLYTCIKCGNKRCPHATNHLCFCNSWLSGSNNIYWNMSIHNSTLTLKGCK